MVVNMKRNKTLEALNQDELIGKKQRLAFHEAGHAAGVHLNNKSRNLPPVFFKIIVKETGNVSETDVMTYQAAYDDCIARVEGGRLIKLLPPAIDKLAQELMAHQGAMALWLSSYMAAFDADIVNLLIGPLAEAKYVAEADDELFNDKLINLNALSNYGGHSDIILVNEYLQSFSADKQKKDEKLAELFDTAFDFINKEENWAAITELADYITHSKAGIIYYEEVLSTLEQAVLCFQDGSDKIHHGNIGH